MGDGRQHQRRIANGGKIDKGHAVGKRHLQLQRAFHSQASLADSAGAGERDQTHIRAQQQGAYRVDFLRPPDQAGQLRRKIGMSRRHSPDRQRAGGCVSRKEWYQALRSEQYGGQGASATCERDHSTDISISYAENPGQARRKLFGRTSSVDLDIPQRAYGAADPAGQLALREIAAPTMLP